MSCIPAGGSCPRGCTAVTAALVDASAACVHADVPVVPGCAPYGTGSPRIHWCYQSSDATVTVRSDYQYEIGVDDNWRDCSIDLRTQVGALPFCQ